MFRFIVSVTVSVVVVVAVVCVFVCLFACLLVGWLVVCLVAWLLGCLFVCLHHVGLAVRKSCRCPCSHWVLYVGHVSVILFHAHIAILVIGQRGWTK